MANLILPAKLENLEKMFAFIHQAAASQGFDQEKSNKIQLACEEALVNVINYAYSGKIGDLEIICENKEKGLEIQIIDCGVAFDPLSLASPDINAPIEERRVGGLGVFLMRKIMDEVTYQRIGEHNILKLVKY